MARTVADVEATELCIFRISLAICTAHPNPFDAVSKKGENIIKEFQALKAQVYRENKCDSWPKLSIALRPATEAKLLLLNKHMVQLQAEL